MIKIHHRIFICFLVIVVFMCSVLSGCINRKKNTISFVVDDSRDVDRYGYSCSVFKVKKIDGYETFVSSSSIDYFGDEYCIVADYYDESNNYAYSIVYCYSNGGELIDSSDLIYASSRSAVYNGKYYYVIDNIVYIYDLNAKIESELCTIPTNDIVNFISFDEDGFIVVSGEKLFRFDLDFNCIGKISSNYILTFADIDSMYHLDGKDYLMCSNGNANVTYSMDYKDSKLVEEQGEINLGIDVEAITGKYAYKGEYIYKLDMADKKIIKLFNEKNISYRPALKRCVNSKPYILNDDSIVQIFNYLDGTTEILVYTYDENKELSDIPTITIMGELVESDPLIQMAIFIFNNTHDEYRITTLSMDEYSYSTADEAQQSKLRLMSDLSTNGYPDMFYGNFFDYQYLGRNGIVYDIDELLDEDIATHFDFTSGVCNIYSKMDAYSVFSGYTLDGYWTLKELWMNPNEITIADINNELLNGNYVSAYGQMYTYDIIDSVIRYSLYDNIINHGWSNKIDSGDLYSIVDHGICNGRSIDEGLYYLAGFDEVVDGSILFSRMMAGDILFVNSIYQKLGVVPYYAGIPGIYNSLKLAVPKGEVAVSKDTEYYEQCVEFIEILMSEEVQRINLIYGYMPTNSTLFDEYTTYLKNPELIPEDDDYYSALIPVSGYSDEVVESYIESTQSVDTIALYDWGVFNVIYEELNDYYRNNKSIEEVVAVISSRLQIYIAENYT